MNPFAAQFFSELDATALAQKGLFYLCATICLLAAAGVVASRNVIHMAVSLLFTLLGVAGLYFLLNAEFLAAVQLVIYAGGTLILIIFGVMLTSKSPLSQFQPRRWEVIVGGVTAGVLLVGIWLALKSSLPELMRTPGVTAPATGPQYPVRDLGQALLGDYLLPFELASVLLLVVMIGAAYLAKGRRRVEDAPPA